MLPPLPPQDLRGRTTVPGNRSLPHWTGGPTRSSFLLRVDTGAREGLSTTVVNVVAVNDCTNPRENF